MDRSAKLDWRMNLLAPFDALPIGDGWYQSEWFGLFEYIRVFSGFTMLSLVGFIMERPIRMGSGSGRKERAWLWSRLDTWPYVWRHNTSSWLYSFGIRQGRPTWWDYQNQSFLSGKAFVFFLTILAK